MSKKATFTREQIAKAAELRANGKSQNAISQEMNLGIHSTRKLLKEVEVNEAIERLRLTDVIPRKLEELASANLLLVQAIHELEVRLSKTEQVSRMMTKAMKRLQVENKNLRETRRDARAELRKVKEDLWKARGYK